VKSHVPHEADVDVVKCREAWCWWCGGECWGRTGLWTLKLCRCGIWSILEPQAPIALSIFKMGRKHVSSLALILPLLASTADAASDPARPRGVGPDCMLHKLQLMDSLHVYVEMMLTANL
jgi:hypothetical protein